MVNYFRRYQLVQKWDNKVYLLRIYTHSNVVSLKSQTVDCVSYITAIARRLILSTDKHATTYSRIFPAMV
jgi:hypothetical protein